MPVPLFTFWDGPLTWLERVCLTSQVEQGHTVTLFSYGAGNGDIAIPGVQMKDARAILPMTPEITHILQITPQIVADWFRYRGLSESLGIWVDTDMFLVKPVPSVPRLYGFEHHTRRGINNAVLYLNPDDAILRDLLAFSDCRPVMAPWWGGMRALKHAGWNTFGWPIPPERCQWGVFGPKALTYYVRKHGGWNQAVEPSWFYPVPFDRTTDLVTDDVDVLEFMMPETVGIHLWGSKVRKLLNGNSPPSRSVLGRALRYGVP